jgi:hypothetical protein
VYASEALCFYDAAAGPDVSTGFITGTENASPDAEPFKGRLYRPSTLEFVAALGGAKVVSLTLGEFLEGGGSGNEGPADRIFLEFAAGGRT